MNIQRILGLRFLWFQMNLLIRETRIVKRVNPTGQQYQQGYLLVKEK